MDRERYTELVADAVGKANRLLAVSDGQNSVVLVMSRAMRNEILVQEGANYTMRNGDYVEEYCGYRVGIVNEIDDEEFILPAMVGMAYHPGMQIDDVIVVDDENRLFRLENTDPVQFADMGLTVSFGLYVDVATTATADNVATISADLANTIATTANTATITIDDFVGAVSNITWDGVLNAGAQTVTATDGMNWWLRDTHPIPDYYSRLVEYSPPKRKARKKEEELSAGDTKLLDEFLSGFARNGA
jgi:hypothetical protein